MRRIPFRFVLVLLLVGVCRADDLTPLPLREVRVGGEIGRRIDITLKNNLLVLDADKDFLAPFEAKSKKDGYIGLGKLIDATTRVAAYTNDPRALDLRKKLIDRTIAAQEPDGYIGILEKGQRVHGLWDVHETQYVIFGLLSDYELFKEQRSLDAARKAADFLIANWSVIPPDWAQKSDVAEHVAVTGLERTMLMLHRITGEAKYLDFVIKQRKLPEWDLGIVIGRRAPIEGHVYAYLARCLAQTELFRIKPEEKLLGQTTRAMEFMTCRNGLLITGATGQCEIWTDDQDGRGEPGETCATAYQIRLYESLLRLRGEARFGDLIERTVYNTLFAAQSPDGRKLRYFAPLEGPRVYWQGDTYCCPCNYRRIVAELPAMAYYTTKDGVAVNLYAPGEARFKIGDTPITLRQITDYPNSGKVELVLDMAKPVEFGLRLRIPSWAEGASVRVEGAPMPPVKAGTFFHLKTEWSPGWRVTLDLPMKWRLIKGRQRQAGRIAVMRGPLVFCLNPAQNPQLAQQDGASLGLITLDPASLKDPIPSAAVRPDGLAVKVQAWKPGFSLSRKGDFELTLTEFPDPDCKATYFRLRDMSAAEDDELLRPL